jgi:hypothetical protein
MAIISHTTIRSVAIVSAPSGPQPYSVSYLVVAGGGGGGGGGAGAGGGGAGIVIISYSGSQRGLGGTVTSAGGNTIHTFTSSGTYTA